MWASFPVPGVQVPGQPSGVQVVPNFPVSETQAKTNWCWAAVCTAILRARGQPADQAGVVARVLGAAAVGENQTALLSFALQRLGLPKTALAGPLLEYLNVDAQFDAYVRGPIGRGHPLAITIVWNGGPDAHAICAFGYGLLDGQKALVIYDPAEDEDPDNVTMVTVAGMMAYAPELSAVPKSGQWNDAYIVGEV